MSVTQNSERESLIIIQRIANILDDIIKETDSMQTNNKSLFHASKRPTITILNYLQRVEKYAKCSDACYILALIFLDKLQEINPHILINSLCIHRQIVFNNPYDLCSLLITSILIAIKYHDDEYYKNEYYAKVGGISLKEVNQLEVEFLRLIGYSLYVDIELYRNYQQKLTQYMEIE